MGWQEFPKVRLTSTTFLAWTVSPSAKTLVLGSRRTAEKLSLQHEVDLLHANCLTDLSNILLPLFQAPFVHKFEQMVQFVQIPQQNK